MNADDIIKSVDSVTKKWTKQRKSEVRRANARMNRRYVWSKPKVTLVDAAEEVMEEAYNKASANGKYPAHARQIMYAARPRMLEIADDVEKLDSKYFTQTLLPNYMERHGLNGDWDVVYDARGHFTEPHTEESVALGTIGVRSYLSQVRGHKVGEVDKFQFKNSRYPTKGPAHRFGAVLFIEKEGFMPLFEEVELAERYDIAIMSTKGMSVTAARMLVDSMCGGGVPLLVLHDLDRQGFSILASLQRSNRRYQFTSGVNQIDLGLRLEDVQKHGLLSEPAFCSGWKARQNLARNGATEEEIAFLLSGERVELNAFMNDELVEWIESKLKEHGIEKVVPDADTLESAYRRALEIEYVNARLPVITKAAGDFAENAKAPNTLERTIRKRLKENPEMPWDKIVSDLAARRCKKRAKRKSKGAS